MLIDLNDLDDTTIPVAPEFRTASGRLKRTGDGVWALCAANEPRTYWRDGAAAGVLFDEAETIKSAPFQAAPANSASPQFITAAGTGATVVQSGAGSDKDIFGSTGKCVRCNAGSASSDFRAANIPQAVVNGDRVRIVWVGYFLTALAAHQPRLKVYTAATPANFSSAIISVAIDGTVTTIAPNSATAAGFDLFDTLPTGEKIYRIWADIPAAATGTLAPVLQLSTGVSAVTTAIYSIKNPATGNPTAVPVFDDKPYAADAIQIGTDDPMEVEWANLACGRTRVTDGLLIPPRSAATPAVPFESRITVAPAQEDTARSYILPSPRMDAALTLASGGSLDIYLGPGFYDVQPTFNALGTVAIRGAYADPARWPRLRGMISSNLVSSLTLENLAFWMRTGLTAIQSDAHVRLSSLTTWNNVLATGAVSYWVPQAPDLDIEDPATYPHGPNLFGLVTLSPGSAGTIDLGNCLLTEMFGGVTLNAATTGTAIMLRGQNLCIDKVNADCLLIGRGTFDVDIPVIGIGTVNGVDVDWYQSDRQIEVDIGSGFVPILSSGIATSDLPGWRSYYRYGTYSGGTITEAPVAVDRIRIYDFKYFTFSGYDDKDGYQFASTPVAFLTPLVYEQLGGDGTVWVSDTVGDPSPTNPRVRVFMRYGHWFSGSFVSTAGPAADNIIIHGDGVQVTRTDSILDSFVCPNLVMWGQGRQAFFTGMSVPTDSEIRTVDVTTVLISAYGMGFNISTLGGGDAYPKSIAGVMLPVDSTIRFVGGTTALPAVVAQKATIDASGLWQGTLASDTGRITQSGGTITGTLKPIAVGGITGNTTVVEPSVNQPGVRPTIYDFVEPQCIVNARIGRDVGPAELKFTGYALTKTGYDLNGMVEAVAQGPYSRFAPALANCRLEPPTHDGTVSNAAAVGTAVTLSVTALGRRESFAEAIAGVVIEGDERQRFVLDGGVLKVARSLAGITDSMALVTDQGERIRLMIQ